MAKLEGWLESRLESVATVAETRLKPGLRLGRRRLVLEGSDLHGDAEGLMAAVAAVGKGLQAHAGPIEVLAGENLPEAGGQGAQLHGPLKPGLLPLVLGRPQHQQIAALRDQQRLAARERPALGIGNLLAKQSLQAPKIGVEQALHEQLGLGYWLKLGGDL